MLEVSVTSPSSVANSRNLTKRTFPIYPVSPIICGMYPTVMNVADLLIRLKCITYRYAISEIVSKMKGL